MLSIENVSFRFGTKTVLDDINLDVSRGSFVSFLGPSGCGKTTLLRIIAGFLAPSAGAVLLDGKPLSTPQSVLPAEHRGMGMVFQNYAVWPHMSVYGNVSYGLRLRRLPAAVQRARTMKALELVNLQDFESRSPSELSGGQQQRVAIARSIATEPNVLLLDEPLSNLDVTLRRELLFDLKRIQQASGITFIYVTHDQGEALSISDKVAVLDQGRVRQIASPREVYNAPSDLFVASFVGSANLLAAVAAPGEENHTRLILGEGAEISLPLAEGIQPGAACSIAIKRRGMTFRRLSGTDDSAPCSGVVTKTFFGGDHDEVAVMVGGQEIYGFADPDSLQLGDKVSIEIGQNSFHVFLK